jgi:hypothetical protein
MKSEFETLISSLVHEVDVGNRILTFAIKQWVLQFESTEVIRMDPFLYAFIPMTSEILCLVLFGFG